MKLLLSLSLLLSFSVFADDHDSQESEWNVAEYYVSVFKDGKDMDDMMKWAEKWNNWANETDDLKEYRRLCSGAAQGQRARIAQGSNSVVQASERNTRGICGSYGCS